MKNSDVFIWCEYFTAQNLFQVNDSQISMDKKDFQLRHYGFLIVHLKPNLLNTCGLVFNFEIYSLDRMYIPAWCSAVNSDIQQVKTVQFGNLIKNLHWLVRIIWKYYQSVSLKLFSNDVTFQINFLPCFGLLNMLKLITLRQETVLLWKQQFQQKCGFANLLLTHGFNNQCTHSHYYPIKFICQSEEKIKNCSEMFIMHILIYIIYIITYI